MAEVFRRGFQGIKWAKLVTLAAGRPGEPLAVAVKGAESETAVPEPVTALPPDWSLLGGAGWPLQIVYIALAVFQVSRVQTEAFGPDGRPAPSTQECQSP